MKLIFFILFSLNCLGAMAAVINLPVPRSTIQFAPAEVIEQEKPVYFRLGVTSWSPSSLRTKSRLTSTTEFKPVHNANIKVEMGKEFYSGVNFSARSAIGLTYAQFERSGQLNSGSAVTEYTEDLNVFQFPASVEFLGHLGSLPQLHPLLKFGVGPAYSRAQSGPFSTGVSDINWVAISTIGFSFDLSNKSEYSWLKNSSIALGLERTQGIDSNSFNGEGVWVSLGLDWQ